MSLQRDPGHVNKSFTLGNISTEDFNSVSPSVFVEILKQTYLITIPAICVTGLVGNVLAFFVFVSKPLRRTSCSWYLAARSVSDGGFLFASLLTWTSDASRKHFFHTDGLCQLIAFMTFVFAFLSVWLTVVVTIENYIRICRPFRVQTFCSVAIAWRAILSLSLIGIIMYNYPFWTSKVFVSDLNNTTDFWCTGYKEYQVLLQWLSFWDMLTTFVVPSVIIIFLMVAITFSLIKSLKRQSRLQAGAARYIQHNGASSRSTRSHSSPQAKVTGMLFAVSFFFIVLNGPSHVVRVIRIVNDFLDTRNNELSVEEQAQVFFQIIHYLSFAVNLIIYLTCGQNFRKHFKDKYCFLCTHNHSPGGHSDMTAMSIIRMEEMDHRNEDQAALISRGATIDCDEITTRT